MEYGRRVGMKPPEAYGHRFQECGNCARDAAGLVGWGIYDIYHDPCENQNHERERSSRWKHEAKNNTQNDSPAAPGSDSTRVIIIKATVFTVHSKIGRSMERFLGCTYVDTHDEVNPTTGCSRAIWLKIKTP
jgi:hypothetical protein